MTVDEAAELAAEVAGSWSVIMNFLAVTHLATAKFLLVALRRPIGGIVAAQFGLESPGHLYFAPATSISSAFPRYSFMSIDPFGEVNKIEGKARVNSIGFRCNTNSLELIGIQVPASRLAACKRPPEPPAVVALPY